VKNEKQSESGQVSPVGRISSLWWTGFVF